MLFYSSTYSDVLENQTFATWNLHWFIFDLQTKLTKCSMHPVTSSTSTSPSHACQSIGCKNRVTRGRMLRTWTRLGYQEMPQRLRMFSSENVTWLLTRKHFRRCSETLVISVQPPPLAPCAVMNCTTIPKIRVSPPKDDPKDDRRFHIGDANDLSGFSDLFVCTTKSNPL